MFKKASLLLLCLSMLLSVLLTGCGCKHEWKDATCDTPKTCAKCSKIRGEALGHKWADATCETAKTCSVCQKTDGEALGHKWADATTETPKTCSVCQKTEGDRIITDSRFKTEKCKAYFGSWRTTLALSGSQTGFPDECGRVELIYTLTYNNDGTYYTTCTLKDEAGFLQRLHTYYIDSLYAEFAKQGFNKEQADAAMLATYGKDVSTYAKQLMATAPRELEVLSKGFNTKGVYYVDDTLYQNLNWSRISEWESRQKHVLTDSTLTIDITRSIYLVLKNVQLTRVTEANSATT